MAPLASRPLVDLLDALASNDPVPAGVSAAALAGAAGVSLLLMAASLPRTKTGSPEESTELASAAAQLRPLRESLVALIDRDVDAYAALIAAYRQPKDTEDARARRLVAIGAAMRGATETPLETMRVSREAIGLASTIAAHAARAASADINAAVELLLACVRGAGGSIDANLAALKDEAYVRSTAEERRRLETESASDAERARARGLGYFPSTIETPSTENEKST